MLFCSSSEQFPDKRLEVSWAKSTDSQSSALSVFLIRHEEEPLLQELQWHRVWERVGLQPHPPTLLLFLQRGQSLEQALWSLPNTRHRWETPPSSLLTNRHLQLLSENGSALLWNTSQHAAIFLCSRLSKSNRLSDYLDWCEWLCIRFTYFRWVPFPLWQHRTWIQTGHWDR